MASLLLVGLFFLGIFSSGLAVTLAQERICGNNSLGRDFVVASARGGGQDVRIERLGKLGRNVLRPTRGVRKLI